jgi:ubiquinone/menaquinone biosynthesis C-methylase UbiE
MSGARYDGIADWYEHEFLASVPEDGDTREGAVRLLGDGPGDLLDVGCGTGRFSKVFADHGWVVTGVDVSEDMLRFARERGIDAIRADASRLPFEDACFDAVVSLWTHTDVDDFAAVVREIARVLRPDGPFVYVGAHPCFVGPHSRFVFAQGIPQLHNGYRTFGRYGEEAPAGINTEGLRAKVGAVHLPLGEFLQTFLEAGFRLEHFEEAQLREYPHMLILRWRR